MSPEAQRIAIAEACGNKPHTPGAHGVLRWIMEDHEPTDIGDGVLYLDDLPDYLNDLNAMHEAEKALGLAYDRWTRELRAICERDRRCIESAKASQRAEAFLRTIGKWQDTAAEEAQP